MKQIVTDFEKELYWQESTVSEGPYDEKHQLAIYPQYQGQTIRGFGGAFTEAAGWCFQQLTEEDQERFLQAYFGKEGLGYTMGRTHMNSCDFSLGNYACTSQETEPFQMERDEQYILPLIHKAQQTAGTSISLLLTPWSPPPFMKTNGEMNHGGKLIPKYRELWAHYMACYVQGYQKAGCQVDMVSVQNEPAAVQTWDSCIYTGKEEGEFAVSYLRPALDAAGEQNVGILLWDHNKELLFRRAVESMEVPGAEQAVKGFGFHWYSGDHFEALSMTQSRFPEKELWFTEGCVEYCRFGDSKGPDKGKMYAHDLLGNLSHGACACLDWNLLLDEKGGPNHVGNFCEAPIMLRKEGGFVINPSYYAIGHFSRYIRPGAVRLGASIYHNSLESAVFRNQDGSTVAVIFSKASQTLPVWITEDGKSGYTAQIEPGTLNTFIW